MNPAGSPPPGSTPTSAIETGPAGQRIRLEEHDITVVAGPAGSGKTTLLATWYQDLLSRGEQPCWLTIEARHGQLEDVKRLVDACVAGHRGQRAVASTSGPAPALSQPRDRVVFIDDAGLLDRRVIDELVDWFDQLPGRPWRLVLASRAVMHLSTRNAPHRAIRSIGPTDLRLDDSQVERCLRQGAPDLDPAHRTMLVERISGWAAGIELALSEADPEPGDTDDLLTGRDPRVADFFEREVLNGLPLSDQDFLIWTSVLSKPSIEACDQINGGRSSAERLARLATLNAFLYPAPDGDGHRWFPLGREFLLERLRQRDRAPEYEARRRLLRWCLSRRHYDEAVTQAVQMEDWTAISDIALDAGLHVIGCGRADDLIGWLDQLPQEVVDGESGVAVIAAMALWVARGDEEAAAIDDLLARAAVARRGRPPRQAESLAGAIDAGRAAFSRLGPRTRKLFAERALRLGVGDGTAWAALAHAAAGLAAFLDDEPREARRALTKSLEVQTALDVESRRWVSRLFSPYVLGLLALVELEAGGHHNRAAALISAAELQSHGSRGPGSEIVLLAKARAALADGDRATALDLSLRSAVEGRLHAFGALGWFDAASIYCELGEAERSAACLAAAEQLLRDLPDSGRLLSKRRRAIERQVQLGRSARWSSIDDLSGRELEVLKLLDSDLSRREIARELYLSFETVKTYVQRLYQKLGVSSRAAAVSTAHAWGWLDESGSPDAQAETALSNQSPGSPG